MSNWNDIPDDFLAPRSTSSTTRAKSKDRRARTPLSSTPSSATPSRPSSIPPRPPIPSNNSHNLLPVANSTPPQKEKASGTTPLKPTPHTQNPTSTSTSTSTPLALALPLPTEPVHTWSFLRRSIITNTLHDLHRTPSQLSAYQSWCTLTKSQHGSIPAFLLRERLHWTPLPPRPSEPPNTELRFWEESETLFGDERDYKVLRNDWPYALERGVLHVCVWVKGRMGTVGSGEGRGRGVLSRGSWEACEGFVRRVFGERVERGERERALRDAQLGVGGREGGEGSDEEEAFEPSWEKCSNGGGDGRRVLWFKNWVDLQSVRGIDHIHVLIRDAPEEWLREWMK